MADVDDDPRPAIEIETAALDGVPGCWSVEHLSWLRDLAVGLRGAMSRDINRLRRVHGNTARETLDGNAARNHLTRAIDHLNTALERLETHPGELPTRPEGNGKPARAGRAPRTPRTVKDGGND